VDQPRRCLASFRDGEGVEHVAEVAAGLRIEVCESTFYHVKVNGVEAWLKRSGGAPRVVATRHRVPSRLDSGGH